MRGKKRGQMMDEHTTKATIVVDATSDDTKAPPVPAADRLAEAMACVAWDGTVDTNRLASIEFAHDEAAARRVIGLAATLMDSPQRTKAMGARDSITLGGVNVCDGWETRPFVGVRHNGAWHAEARALAGGEAMTDEHLGLYCALAARGPRFSLFWSTQANDTRRTGRHDRSRTDGGWCLEWRSMWMSRVIGALAVTSGAWTGDQVMRTQALARALSAILRARNARGPLGTLDKDNFISRPSQISTPPGDDALARVREATLIATNMPRGIEFASAADLTPLTGTDYDAVHAVALLELIVNSTQRVYETQSLYAQVILPAEYDALQRNTPTGAFK
ncbi:hypothetical protein psal_cds_1167 [Pandoravirus salinus]|uniref:Uncharacterized protein n=1 Tax=Pandoravirus salinus TaxID=1349410 RepID=S4W0X0_9VIRU|nr:hypothetical protein psal_cds_1167 [Pandoravirus salinus]AGO85441.1 hypothetical protein psal_cds_1167 [Pandoravirus salinus]